MTSTYITETIELPDYDAEVIIEAWFDGTLHLNAFGLNPTRGLTGWRSDLIPAGDYEEIQKRIDADQDLAIEAMIALEEQERRDESRF